MLLYTRLGRKGRISLRNGEKEKGGGTYLCGEAYEHR